MRIYLFIICFFTLHPTFSQCHDLLSTKLENIEMIPYALYDKVVFQMKPGQTSYVKLNNVSYKTKLAFLFQSKDLGDTMRVSLITLNRKLLATKLITNDDCILRYQPVRKTENYFLKIESKSNSDSINIGCCGIAILERVIKKPFKSIQKIDWKD